MRRRLTSLGRRSKFEERLEAEYLRGKVEYSYESFSYQWQDKVPRAYCEECGSKDTVVDRWYTPDFFIGNGVIIEAKGKLDAKERKKLIAVRDTHDELSDLKIVFMRDNKIHRRSETRYSKWAEQNGFDYAINEIPERWLK